MIIEDQRSVSASWNICRAEGIVAEKELGFG